MLPVVASAAAPVVKRVAQPRTIARGILVLVIVIAAILGFAMVAGAQGNKVEVACGPTVSMPLGDRGLDVGAKIGDKMASPDFSSPLRIVRTVIRTLDMIRMWLRNTADHAQGLPEGSTATGWRKRTAENKAAELAKCCVTYNPPQQQDPSTPPTEPFDRRSLSVSQSSSLTGPQLAADALRKAGFPESEIPTFVAIAEHESGFRNVSGPTVSGGTMRGMWQLNDRYWAHSDWKDPYANARMAKKVRDESVKNGRGPYYPWSTRNAAARDSDKYQSLSQSPTTPPSTGTPDGPSVTVPDMENQTPPSGCPTTGTGQQGSGSLTARVATWNVNRRNSTSRIQDGFRALSRQADIIGGQEMGMDSRRRAAAQAATGMAMTDDGTAVPIFYNTTKFQLLGNGRVKAFGIESAESSHGDGGRPGPKFVTWARLKDKEAGSQVTIINTHMLVGWQKGQRRAALYQRQLNTVLALHGQFKSSGPVLVTGDFNKTRVPQMAAHNLTSSLTQGTHGSRTIDRIYSSGASPVSHTIVGKFGSDHSAVIATFVRQSVSTGSVPATLTGTAPAGYPIRPDGMAPNTARARQIINATFQMRVTVAQCAIQRGGHVRDSYHYTGHACDIMVGISKGSKIAAWSIRNADSLGVVQVIHNRTIWTKDRGWTPRPYSGPSAHTDHVHLSFDRSRRGI